MKGEKEREVKREEGRREGGGREERGRKKTKRKERKTVLVYYGCQDKGLQTEWLNQN